VFENWLAVCRTRGASIVAISHDVAFTQRHFSRIVRLHNKNLMPSDMPLQASSPA
ncbi:ABC transporter ATP-binding protein, partial [Citrobacter freundii]